LDGQIWALKADSLTSPLIVTVTVTDLLTIRIIRVLDKIRNRLNRSD